MKPRLTFWQIWNMSFGFFGIQFGFALQNANASRILTTYGAHVEDLSLFWLAAPLTGMIIQPLIGYYSDRTWNRLGRRRPYFLTGALIASVALVFMPNADFLIGLLPSLYVGAGILMIMDASFNVAMEPFRALVADLLPTDQRTLGFATQSFFIGTGAVIGSWLTWVLAEWFDISRDSSTGIASNVSLAFYIGAIVFIVSILWTVLSTKEYPPDKNDSPDNLKHQKKAISQIFSDFASMPKAMKQLGLVQFFSWFALFSMWVFTTHAVKTHIYGLPLSDDKSIMAVKAGDWVGGMFGVYNGVAALYAFFLPYLAHKFGRKSTHAFSLLCGGIGLMSIYLVNDPIYLVIPMIGVGFAWASILAMPYAILAGSIPAHKMGVYMGIFNFFITFPQIVNGVVGGSIVKYVFDSRPIYSIVMAGGFLIIAAFCVRFVEDKDDTITA